MCLFANHFTEVCFMHRFLALGFPTLEDERPGAGIDDRWRYVEFNSRRPHPYLSRYSEVLFLNLDLFFHSLDLVGQNYVNECAH